MQDYVDISVQNEIKSTISSKCSEAYGKTISHSCGFGSTRHEINYNPYICTKSKHPTEKPPVHGGESYVVSPCSQEAVHI